MQGADMPLPLRPSSKATWKAFRMALTCLALAAALGFRSEAITMRPEQAHRDCHLAVRNGAPVQESNVRTRQGDGRGEAPSPEGRFTGTPRELSSAIEDAVRRRDTRVETLSALAAIPLDRDGYVAAAAIRALGDLATEAAPDERAVALRALTHHLEVEQRRAPTDQLSRGNVSLLVDALADSGSPSAVAALASTLDAETLPLHQEIRVVEALTALGDPGALPAIERFQARVQSQTRLEATADELQAEALGAVSRAKAAR